ARFPRMVSDGVHRRIDGRRIAYGGADGGAVGRRYGLFAERGVCDEPAGQLFGGVVQRGGERRQPGERVESDELQLCVDVRTQWGYRDGERQRERELDVYLRRFQPPRELVVFGGVSRWARHAGVQLCV